MRRYDPLRAPTPAQWLALDESERIEMVRRYHERSGEVIPALETHVAIQVVIETQIAMGDELPVGATVARLQQEGLDRHDALHAVGSVLLTHITQALRTETAAEAEALNEAYFLEVRTLTAAGWQRSGE